MLCGRIFYHSKYKMPYWPAFDTKVASTVDLVVLSIFENGRFQDPRRLTKAVLN